MDLNSPLPPSADESTSTATERRSGAGGAPRAAQPPTLASFVRRHVGPSAADEEVMLAAVGQSSLDALMDAVVPEAIRSAAPLRLPPARTERQVSARLQELAGQNTVRTAMIGLGYYPTDTPAVIRRNVLEDPSWYTAYTPYQPEISQGRLEALLNFQTMVADLTALRTSNASLLDEPTAAAEAAALMRRANRSGRVLLVDEDLLPQTLEVLRTRFAPLDVELLGFDPAAGLPADADLFGALVAYPGASGAVRDHRDLIADVHARGGLVAAVTDLMALTLLTPPGELAPGGRWLPGHASRRLRVTHPSKYQAIA